MVLEWKQWKRWRHGIAGNDLDRGDLLRTPNMRRNTLNMWFQWWVQDSISRSIKFVDFITGLWWVWFIMGYQWVLEDWAGGPHLNLALSGTHNTMHLTFTSSLHIHLYIVVLILNESGVSFLSGPHGIPFLRHRHSSVGVCGQTNSAGDFPTD